MRSLRCLLTASLLVACSSAASPAQDVNGWYSCAYSTDDYTPEGSSLADSMIFECAEMQVPLCYDGVCESDRSIEVFVKRRLARSDGVRKALVLIDGGPGYAATSMEGTIKSLLGLLDGAVDFYTFDHRGTGRSEFLTCDAAQALTAGSPNGVELTLNELPSCLKDLNHKYEGQAAAFSTTSAAMDVRTIIDTFLADHEVYVAGFSYGTFVAQRVLQLDVPQVVGYIFDGVDVLTTNKDPIESSNSHWNLAIQTSGKRLLEFCFDDEKCPIEFESRETVVEEVLAIMDKLDENVGTNKCAQILTIATGYKLPSVGLRNWLSGLAGGYTRRIKALHMLSHVQYCGRRDIDAMKKIFFGEGDEEEDEDKGDVPDPLNDMSALLYDAIVYSERWSEPAPLKKDSDTFFMGGVFSVDDEGETYAYCMLTGSQEPACEEIREDLPSNNDTFFYKRDQYNRKPLVLPDHASALILNGGLDFATPQEFGELLYDKLSDSGRGVMMVNFDYGVHCSGEAVAESTDSPCHDAIIAGFITSGGAVDQVDTNCMESLPSTVFHKE